MLIKNMMDLTGRIAVVTGGTGFLGSQMCEALCELGATVYGISRGESQNFAESLMGCEHFIHLIGDVSRPADVNSIIETVIKRSDKIDILVNNAYTWPKVTNFMQASWEDMSKTLESGLVAQLYLTRRVIESMIMNGGGNIINVSSMYGKVAPDHKIYRESGRGNAIEYGASKAALAQATRYIASIGGRNNIRCNSISPGPFPRPGTFSNGFNWFKDELSNRTMLCRPGQPQEIKGAIAFLASDLSSYVTGADIAIDGGWTAW
jgi:gluconate 5-dehydrogenase